MGLVETLREGAADVFGWSEERETLQEANADAQMLARAVEDMDWVSLMGGATSTYFDPTREDREKQSKRAYNYYFLDPIIRRTVDLIGLYTFSEGVPMPRYRERGEDRRSEDRGNDAIKRFWKDPENQKSLFSNQAQLEKDRELFLQGNVFLLLGEAEGPGVGGLAELSRMGDARPSLKIADLPEREMKEIITHPDNRKIPLYYKRVYQPLTFDFEQGQWVPGAQTTIYYRDWRFVAPEGFGPAPALIAPGRVYHLSCNKTSDMRFGMTELQSVLKWAQGLNTYMTNRMALVQALARIAMRAKTKGGQKAVNQVASQMLRIQELAGTVEGSQRLERTAADSARTRATVEGGALDLQPSVSDSNSGNAVNDIQTMKGQIAAGTGLPVHHLGDVGSANLATATSMDGPLLKLITARQEMWEQVYRDLNGRAVELEGLDPERVETTMPPILARDAGNLSSYLTALWSAVDRNAANMPFMRWLLTKVLEAMGEPNPQETVDRILPENAPTPFEQDAAIADAQTAENGGLNSAPERTMGAATRAASAAVRQTAEAEDVAQNMRRRRGSDRAGGADAAGQESRDRARFRAERRANEASLDEEVAGFNAELSELVESYAGTNGDSHD